MSDWEIRRVLKLAGLPEFHGDARPEGGFALQSSGSGDQVRIDWHTEAGFSDRSGNREAENQHDRLARVERGMTWAMTRAVADVLNVAGYTVAVAPEILGTTSDCSDGQDAHLIVLAPPADLTWST